MIDIPKHFNTLEEYQNFCSNVLRYLSNNERELRKYHHEYKTLLNKRLCSRSVTNIRRSLIKNLTQLHQERDEILAKLTPALSVTYKREFEQHLQLVRCHAICQTKLVSDIARIRSEIRDLEKLILKIDRNTYELKKTTISQEQYEGFLKKAENILYMLENQLEKNKKKEGSYFTKNEHLRRTIICLLNERAIFNKIWHKAINRLNSDKKYLVDLVEIAVETLDNSVGIYKKLTAMEKKTKDENEARMMDMQNTFRNITAATINHAFLIAKAKKRKLDDLEPREYKRRQIFEKFHEKKIEIYKKVLSKVLSFSKMDSFEKAIQNFQKQESLYYSYFTYTNELNYQITALNDCINELYGEIDLLKDSNLQNVDMDMEAVADLTAELAKEEASTELKKEEKEKTDKRLEFILQGLDKMFRLIRCNDAPLMFYLGDHSKLTPFNFIKFLKMIEDRLNKVLAVVFVSQRRGDRKAAVVRDVSRDFEPPTNIDDIVLAEQCAECAEGEEVNPYDKEFVLPLAKEDVKKKLRVKVVAPEMQYRLHSIHECRLPRSRLLANKKY